MITGIGNLIFAFALVMRVSMLSRCRHGHDRWIVPLQNTAMHWVCGDVWLSRHQRGTVLRAPVTLGYHYDPDLIFISVLFLFAGK